MLELIIFLLRIVFQVLIYVFIFVVLVYVVRDLNSTGRAASMRKSFGDTREQGYLKMEIAPGESGLEGSEFILNEAVVIGRDPNNEIVLPERVVSNHHAKILFQNGQYWLEDLGSTNGTFLNGLPLNGPALLASGDRIKIGDFIFRFVRWNYEVEYDHRMRSGKTEK